MRRRRRRRTVLRFAVLKSFARRKIWVRGVDWEVRTAFKSGEQVFRFRGKRSVARRLGRSKMWIDVRIFAQGVDSGV